MARKFGNPPANIDPLAYTNVRLAGTPTVDFKKRDPNNLDKDFPIQTIGRNSQTLDEWILVGFNASGANWVKFVGGAGDVITLSDTAGTTVSPDINGNIQLEEAAGISILSDDANDKIVIGLTGATEGVVNLGIDYNVGTGVFKVTSQDGTALSTTNPGYVTLPRVAGLGKSITVKVIADQQFIDGNGASQIIGNIWGLTSGIAYPNAMPFWLYGVINDAENKIQFMISRVPQNNITGVAARIADPSAANATLQGDFFSFEDIDQTQFEQNPVVLIGSFLMTMDASDDWTVLSPLAARDGIGQFQETSQFIFSPGTFGAANINTFMLDNGGTAPTFLNLLYNWHMSIDGFVNIQINCNGDDMIDDGAGTVTSRVATPFNPTSTSVFGTMEVTNAGGATQLPAFVQMDLGSNFMSLKKTDAPNAFVQNADFTAGDRRLRLTYQFICSSI